MLPDKTSNSNQEHGPKRERESEREIHLKLFLLITCGYQKLGSMFLETIKRRRQRRHSITYAIIRLSMSMALWIIISAILHGRGMSLLFRCCWPRTIMLHFIGVLCGPNRYYVHCNYCYRHHHYFVIHILAKKASAEMSVERWSSGGNCWIFPSIWSPRWNIWHTKLQYD